MGPPFKAETRTEFVKGYFTPRELESIETSLGRRVTSQLVRRALFAAAEIEESQFEEVA